MEKMRMESPDITAQNVEKIAALFPNCITEAKDAKGNLKKAIDFDKLRQMLSNDIAEGESYEFTWVGKKAAMVEANTPIRKTLRPCPEESKDWDNTQNLYIEGDNLDVLKLLQESYLGKVKMIYIDPPYNTGKDSFVYPDNYTMDKEEYEGGIGLHDEEGNRLFKENSATNPRFHSDWCSMMYSRILLARNLLSNDGIILVSIGDAEQKNIHAILDEIFGYNNQVCCFVWKSRAKPTNAGNAKFRPQKVSEYIFVYSKTSPDNQIYNVIPAKERVYPHEDENGKYRITTILTSNRGTFRRETMRFESHGYCPNSDFRWKAGRETIDRLYETNHMHINDDGTPMEKKYQHEESDPLYPIYTYIDGDLSGTAEYGKQELTNLLGNKHGFDTVKPTMLIKYLIQTFSTHEDIIVDFFSGSSTTAHAVLEQNSEDESRRKFIMVQLPEPCPEGTDPANAGYANICEIGKERIRRAGAKIKEEAGLLGDKLDTGFRVLKVADSNMKPVYYYPDKLSQGSLLDLESNIKEDRTALDLLFGCLLEWGVPLDKDYHSEVIDGFTVHFYQGANYVACFDSNVSETLIEEIASRNPEHILFRDSCFASAPAKMNMFEICKRLMPSKAAEIRRVVTVL